MIAYTVRRLLVGIPVLFAASLMSFILVAASGDPLERLRMRQPPPSPETIRREELRLHLNESLINRYLFWVKGLFRGYWGPSATNGTQDVGHELYERSLVTLRLVFVAMVLAVIVAVVTGVLSAVRQYSKLDYGFTFFGFLSLSIPLFWFAILLKEGAVMFNEATGSNFFFTIGEKDYNYDSFSTWGKISDIAGHMVLPTISLMLVTYAGWSRYQRGSMLEVLNSDYVRLARAKGLRNRTVMTRHALRTALIPLTTITAVEIAGVFGGAVITETVYNWQGLGIYLTASVNNRDVYPVLACLMVAGIVVVVFNIVADLLYAVLDPRIRYE